MNGRANNRVLFGAQGQHNLRQNTHGWQIVQHQRLHIKQLHQRLAHLFQGIAIFLLPIAHGRPGLEKICQKFLGSPQHPSRIRNKQADVNARDHNFALGAKARVECRCSFFDILNTSITQIVQNGPFEFNTIWCRLIRVQFIGHLFERITNSLSRIIIPNQLGIFIIMTAASALSFIASMNKGGKNLCKMSRILGPVNLSLSNLANNSAHFCLVLCELLLANIFSTYKSPPVQIMSLTIFPLEQSAYRHSSANCCPAE
ncbi:hypothetical protein BpHYR1_026908 [Brachionus plicatilis]|uniref:Uncharacterized protein n=1 Tax=Brachionus plicatilis TaxID=10195 RepID=A0A3M7RPH3_BRAPC|nr:hypothetical protein BpHYR1_026908 [Brachionus plicatilis]